MAITLSEQEKKALGDIFATIGHKKTFFQKILYFFKRFLVYIFEFKREQKREA